jgi:hypothetical protein
MANLTSLSQSPVYLVEQPWSRGRGYLPTGEPANGRGQPNGRGKPVSTG